MAEKEKKENRVVKFFRELKSERKKVTWPTRADTTKQFWVVLLELTAVAIVVGLLDFGISKLFTWLASVL